MGLNTQLDGLTTVLSFIAPVNPGVQNTLVLAIADAGDTILDSAVFIAGGSVAAPGADPDNPILPTLQDENGWVFNFFVVNPAIPIFIDPLVAIGYDFIVNSGPNFQSVILPDIGDGLYDIYDSLDNLLAGAFPFGTPFDFGLGGINAFKVLGIEAGAGLDPNDPLAFVTGLTFAGVGQVNMNMNPITEGQDDSDCSRTRNDPDGKRGPRRGPASTPSAPCAIACLRLRICRASSVAAALRLLLGCSDASRTKNQHLDAGNSYAAARDYDRAISEYEAALKLDPKFDEARLRLTEALAKTSDLPAAARESSRLADLMPDRPDLQITAGKFLAMSGRFEEAKVRAEAVLTKNPHHVEALLLLGNSMLGLHDPAGALAQLEEAAELDPAEGRVQANLGVLQMALGNRESAEAAFRRAVELDGTSAAARLAFAGFYWSGGDVVAAEREFKKALELDPKSVPAHRSIAAFYITTNRPLEAEPHFKAVTRLAAGATPLLELADYYIQMRRYPEAIAILTPLLTDRSATARASTKLAAIALAEGRSNEAHKLVNDVLANDPKDASALMIKSRLLIADKDPDAAIAELKKAVASRAAIRRRPLPPWIALCQPERREQRGRRIQ